MLRSSFFAAGLFVALLGGAFLFVESIELRMKDGQKPQPGFRGFLSRMSNPMRTKPTKTITPPDWAGFSLLSIGGVTMLYALALPKKGGDG